ncbi:hypothetical protein D3C83_11630 [compost metagenome]
MAGDVLQSGQKERVVVRMMPVMAHQRAARALRVVVLAPREPVVDEERDTVLEEAAHAFYKAMSDKLDFGTVTGCGEARSVDSRQHVFR